MKILALDVGGTAVKSAIVDERNDLMDVRTTPTAARSPEGLAQSAIQVAGQYSGYDVLSVSMTGQIDSLTQTFLFQYNRTTGGKEIRYPVGRVLKETLDCPVFLLNDSNAAALGEATFGAGRDVPDFVCLTYGTGVGGGIIQNGRLMEGHRGIAGEVGHMAVHAGGRLCGCGHRGCYEQYASVTALLKDARRFQPELQDARQLFQAAEQDPMLRRVIRKWIREIVEGLCTLAYVFNPQSIILGGGVMEREDVVEMVRCQFERRVIPTFNKVDLIPAQLGNRAGILGAVSFARQKMSEK